jgi:hypothetical protein
VGCVLKKAQLPCKFLSYNPVTLDNDIERQKKLEADAVRDGLLRYATRYEYCSATDSKPVRDLLAQCLNPLADVIRAEQLKLKTTSQGQKLEKYVITGLLGKDALFDSLRTVVHAYERTRGDTRKE